MAIFPMHDMVVDKGYLTETQLGWFNFFQCLMIIFSLATLVWLVHNAWNILIRQKKLDVLPLTNFYALAALLLVFRVVYQIVILAALYYSWLLI